MKEKGFLDIEVGNEVIVYDNYCEHHLLVESVERDEDYITKTNPDGLHCYGKDLDYWNVELNDYEDDDYVTHVLESNFIGFSITECEIMKNCSTCAYPTECNGKFTCNCGDSNMYEKEIDGNTSCECWEEN